MPDRRDVLLGSAALALGGLSGCSSTVGGAYDTTMSRLRAPLGPTPDLPDFVRYATLAPNGHNTQPWRFAATRAGVDILPDLSRRTPVVDPDDHHLFVSLGCAAENLAIAASASGRPASIGFDPSGNGRIAIGLASGQSRDLALCRAIPARQSTRSPYDRRAIPVEDLRSLERAAAVPGVSVLLITDPPGRERVLETVLHANDLQMGDPAFMAELMLWLRFNEAAALRTGDGLYSACSGSRTSPTWLGKRMFPLFFTKASETERYTEQLRSSSGIAVFIGDRADRDHWVRVGRSFERFALQATVLGLRHAHVNQPIEVPAVRSAFAKSLGLGDGRPDLVIRFGAAPALPMAMRRAPKIT
ncbi:Acg family FMN-binding oxidoreductase [Sphingomonas montana]|uniref:Acg family FMN-binding oxidoreductase n=1 Tax=Sphingomonas montana TaxID=1843236 RepID=UPI00096CD76C|nr:hypothetical protein [Sphingomonas montana]